MNTNNELNWKKSGKILEISGYVPATASHEGVEIRLYSDRNRRISRFTDVSPRDVNRTDRYLLNKKLPVGVRTAELWFPVVDVKLEPSISAAAVFADFDSTEANTGIYSVNGLYHHESYPLQPFVHIPGSLLEEWENGLHISGANSRLVEFYLKRSVEVENTAYSCRFELLTEDWSGDIAVYSTDTAEPVEIARASVTTACQKKPEYATGHGDSAESHGSDGSDADKPEAERPEVLQQSQPLSPEIHSLLETIGYILRSRNLNPNSRTYGGLNLFYDHDARTFRQNAWIWPWGPAIRLLLEASAIPAAAERFGAETLVEAAQALGEATLRFRVDEPGHPAEGLIVCRYDPSIGYPQGYTGFISPADTLFLAGWGWGPLFEHTGDSRYLEAIQASIRGTARILQEDVIIKQDYLTKEEYWVDHTLDESGFGMEGFAELYRLTGDEACKEIGRRYIGQMIERMERQDGLWERSYHRSVEAAAPTNCNTRGMGWAMEGLLASHRLMPEGPYLEKAVEMAEHLVRHQLPDGSWAFEFNKTPEFLGIAEKGTALWSVLLYRLAGHTGEMRFADSARKALQWTMEQHYTGEQADGRGGIIGCSPASGVIYRPFYHMSCAYTSAFHGIALLEDRRISQLRRN